MVNHLENIQFDFQGRPVAIKSEYDLEVRDGQNSGVYERLVFQIELMQFTGLEDKHGKEIYEGDVVRHRRFDGAGDMAIYGVGAVFGGDRPIRVEFSHCGFQPFANWIDDAQNDFEWEVIGNIYENPELLK